MTAPYVLLGNEGQSAAHRGPSSLEFRPGSGGSPCSVMISTKPLKAPEKQKELREGHRAGNDEQDHARDAHRPAHRPQQIVDRQRAIRKDWANLRLKVIDIFRSDE